MASYNRVVLVGNLTRDPEVRYLPSGMQVAELGLAVNDRRKTPEGNWVDEPTFVDISLFGNQAETAGRFLKKGSSVLIEGRLKLDSWQSQDGQKRTKLKVVGDRMVMLGGRGGGGEEEGGGQSGGWQRRESAPASGGGARGGYQARKPAASAPPSYDEGGDYGDHEGGASPGAAGGGRYGGRPETTGGGGDDDIPF